MKERLQLNLRMDDQEELLEAVKAQAKAKRITVKELVIDALQQHLQQIKTESINLKSQNNQTITLTEAHDLKERVNDLRIGLMGEIRKRDEQLNQHQEMIAELALAIARLEAQMETSETLEKPCSDTHAHSQTRQSRQKGASEIQTPKVQSADLTEEEIEKLTPWKQWEAVCTDMVDDFMWEDMHGRDK